MVIKDEFGAILEELVRENSRLAYDVRLLKAAVYIMIAVVVVMLIFLLSAGGNPW